MKNKTIRDRIDASISLIKSIQKKSDFSQAKKTKGPLKILTSELDTTINLQKEVRKLKNDLKTRKKELEALVKKLSKDQKEVKKARKEDKKAAKIAKTVGKIKKPVRPRARKSDVNKTGTRKTAKQSVESKAKIKNPQTTENVQ